MKKDNEPNLDIAHLGHLELLTPTFDKSVRFFVDIMGMTICGEKGDSVYLAPMTTTSVTRSNSPRRSNGMAHVAYRCRSPQALERRAAALKGSGFDVGWTDGDLGHGKTFVCKDPDGHVIELYYDTEWYEAPPELKPALKNQAQAFPGRGCNVRRLDHWNGLAADISACRKFFEDYLGFRLTERIVLNDGSEAGIWLTATNKSYDFAYTRDHTGVPGRFHHITYALNSREEILLAADIFLENGVFIETGPHGAPAVQQSLLPLRLRAGRQSRRGRQRRRQADPRSRLEADHLDRGRAQEGAGLGPQDHEVLPHTRNAGGGA